MFLVGVPEMGLAKLGQKEENIRFLQLFKTHVIPETATDRSSLRLTLTHVTDFPCSKICLVAICARYLTVIITSVSPIEDQPNSSCMVPTAMSLLFHNERIFESHLNKIHQDLCIFVISTWFLRSPSFTLCFVCFSKTTYFLPSASLAVVIEMFLLGSQRWD